MVNKVESGFGETFSAMETVLKKGREWSNGNVVKQISSHVVTPVTVVAAAAIDLVAHLVFVAVKTVGFAFNAILFVVSVGNIDINASLMPSQIFKHAYRAAVTVAFVVVAAPLSIFSSKAALNLAQALGLARDEAPKGALREFWEGIPAGWNSFSAVSAKASYVAKGCFFGAVNGTRSVISSVVYGAQKLTDSEHRNAVIGSVAALALVYAAAAYQMGDAFAPAQLVGGAVVDGAALVGNSLKGVAGYAWSFVSPPETWENWVKGMRVVPGVVGDYAVHPAFWVLNNMVDPVLGYTAYPVWNFGKSVVNYSWDTAAAHSYVSTGVGLLVGAAWLKFMGIPCKNNGKRAYRATCGRAVDACTVKWQARKERLAREAAEARRQQEAKGGERELPPADGLPA